MVVAVIRNNNDDDGGGDVVTQLESISISQLKLNIIKTKKIFIDLNLSGILWTKMTSVGRSLRCFEKKLIVSIEVV